MKNNEQHHYKQPKKWKSLKRIYETLKEIFEEDERSNYVPSHTPVDFVPPLLRPPDAPAAVIKGKIHGHGQDGDASEDEFPAEDEQDEKQVSENNGSHNRTLEEILEREEKEADPEAEYSEVENEHLEGQYEEREENEHWDADESTESSDIEEEYDGSYDEDSTVMDSPDDYDDGIDGADSGDSCGGEEGGDSADSGDGGNSDSDSGD